MELTRIQAYKNKLSISAKKGVKDNFTYDFKLADFDFKEPTEDLHIMGFTPMVYLDGHRRKDSYVGLTDIGYFDIDLGEDKPMKYEDFQPLISAKYALVIAQSKSGAIGKYRLIYKRNFTIEDGCIIDNGLGVILYQFESKEESALFVEYILNREIEKLIKRVPAVKPHIDCTACKVHMHSSWIGDYLYHSDGVTWMDSYLKDIQGFHEYKSRNYRAFEKCSVAMLGISDKGVKTRFKTEKKENGKIVHRANGNTFHTSRGLMTISQILSCGARPQLCDVIEDRIRTADAFMPFIVSKYKQMIILSSNGIHDRNKNEKIQVIFNKGTVDKDNTVEMSIDNNRYAIDEINLTYKEIKCA